MKLFKKEVKLLHVTRIRVNLSGTFWIKLMRLLKVLRGKFAEGAIKKPLKVQSAQTVLQK